MAIIVAPSPRSPHAVLGHADDKKHPLRFPVRNGTDTRYLTEHEVAEQYMRRFRAEAERTSGVKQVVQEGCEALMSAEGVWLFVATVPELPVPVALTDSSVRATRDWLRANLLNGPLGGYIRALGRGVPGPGKVTFSGSQHLSTDDETLPREGYLELHLGGASFVATPIGQAPSSGSTSIGVDESAFVEDVVLSIDVALKWTERQAGAWGNAVVVAGFFDTNATEASSDELFAPLVLFSSASSDLLQMPGTRTLRRAPRVTTAADMAAVGTVQDRLQVSHNVAARLLQWFGLANPPLLTEDGSLAIPAWDSTRFVIQRWAADNDVVARWL